VLGEQSYHQSTLTASPERC